ncbi:MAG: succinate dehydrogenase, cytochrome b556 subunit [Alphaproteobacteria bacterium]|nr:succinate dehydrogenase, cytochrome b556 subunit [Alphaproteobacteria bacterium]MBF0250168.1 succinate dehydrogenase, cytochrome b556 subunit [Alphaproteobacteria bacterium]
MADPTRPLSPHLTVYRPQVTSVLSITHRATGVFLAFAAVLFTYWLVSAAYGPEAFGRAQALLESWFGRLVLFGFTFSLFYHLLNGIRHLGWDVLWGFEMPTLRATGVLVVIASLAMTVTSWLMAYGHVGKL